MEVLLKPDKARRSGILGWQMPLRWYRRLTLVNAIAIWLLIVLGGLVRVTDSGTGCGNSWPMCQGSLLPKMEYHQLIEWNHRFIAWLVGWLMVATILSTLIWFRRPRRLMWLALAGGFFYVLQAVLGGLTVLFSVGHTWSALHMGNSMLLMAAVILLATYSRIGPVSFKERNRKLKWLSLGTLIWTYLALYTGSAVVGADATVACPSWPDCSPTQIFPSDSQQWINFLHRMSVGLSDILILSLGVLLWIYRRSDRRMNRVVRVMGILYLSQVFLGAFTVWLNGNPALKGAHLSLAAATWAALVVMVTFIWIGPKQENESGGFGGGNSESENAAELVRKGRKAHRWDWIPEPVRNYVGLMRPNVIPLLLVPTIASMLIAAVQQEPARPLWELILWTSLGGTLATGGAHAINQYLDRDIDARMKRTKRRAVVTGRVTPEKALVFGIIATGAGVIQLALTVNLLAAALSLGGNLFYVVVYTMWLKRTTVQNIVIGGAAGAVPPLVGWAAVTNSVGLPAILFFAIIFFWTPAHFWALALVRHEEYEAAGVPMLPVVRGEAETRKSILLYTVLMVAVTLLPFFIQALSWVYFITAAVLGFQFLRKSAKLARSGSTTRAWKLFKFSNTYLAMLYLMMVVDRLLALG
ncbi:MAG TPA: heme o synthase [Chloroflexia bacterium]|nr:heme o synthase [Chloroflexia bacterium]